METIRTLYFYVSTVIVAVLTVGTLVLTGLVLGFLLGRWALLPMVGLVILLVGAWAVRDIFLNTDADS